MAALLGLALLCALPCGLVWFIWYAVTEKQRRIEAAYKFTPRNAYGKARLATTDNDLRGLL